MDYYPENQEITNEQKLPETEPLFENTHIRDKRFFKEFWKRSLLSPLFIIASTLFGIVFLYGLYAYIFKQKLILVDLIGPICFFAFVIAIYFLNVHTWNKRQNELSLDQPVVYTTQFFEDRFIAKTSNGASHEIRYSVVPKYASTKSYGFLITKARQSFPIGKDGFTKGTYEDFCDFLKAKGYKVKK